MHPPSVPADRHIDAQYFLYLRTNRPNRYCIPCDQATLSAPHTFSLEHFQTPLRLQRPRYACFLVPSLSFLYNSVVELPYSLRFLHNISGNFISTATDIFKLSTANSKILFRDPFRATSKPTFGTVCACPISRIQTRTLVSRPFFSNSDVLPGPCPPKSSVFTIIIPRNQIGRASCRERV